MKFLKIFLPTLLILCAFIFFGGFMLFDFSRNPWLAAIACAFVISVVISAFAEQNTKIEELEARLKALEEKKDSSL